MLRVDVYFLFFFCGFLESRRFLGIGYCLGRGMFLGVILVMYCFLYRFLSYYDSDNSYIGSVLVKILELIVR